MGPNVKKIEDMSSGQTGSGHTSASYVKMVGAAAMAAAAVVGYIVRANLHTTPKSTTTMSSGRNASCTLVGDGISGTVSFSQANAEAETTITVEINGVPEGNHGFHIHQHGDLTNGCKSTGGHFNPFGKTHGGPTDDERHVGDLGNAVADADGNINTTGHAGGRIACGVIGLTA